MYDVAQTFLKANLPIVYAMYMYIVNRYSSSKHANNAKFCY